MSFDPCFSRRIAALAAVTIHALALVALLMLSTSEPRRTPPEPIIVRWVEPAPPEPPKPMPIAPKIRPQVKPAPQPERQKVTQPEPPPILAAAEAAPAPQAAAVPPPPQTTAPVTPGEPVQQAVPTPAPPISPPLFNADYLHNPAPTYPALSRRLGESGRVVLRVLVTTVGTAERIELRTSSGSRRLDSAALETVQRWKFVPARQGDTPVAAWVLVPILFTLES